MITAVQPTRLTMKKNMIHMSVLQIALKLHCQPEGPPKLRLQRKQRQGVITRVKYDHG